jgi:ribonuclease-3
MDEERPVDLPPGPPLSQLEERLGYTFRNPELLERAMTHPSFAQLLGNKTKHNQRLEFLGDAVLGMILAERLYATLPSEREGVLTKNRSALVKGEQLSQLSRDLGLPAFIRLSEAEERNQGRRRHSILEDALEAAVGAIYLDSDYTTVREVVLQWYGDLDARLDGILNGHNPKGRLQEIVQPRLGNTAIEYSLVDETGPAHRKQFVVEVRIDGEAAGQGKGSSKKAAEEAAATSALDVVESLLPPVEESETA